MNDQFYTRLPVNRMPLTELLLRENLFYQVPRDWHIIITDIKNSTQAVLDGQHESVNLIATGSIVAVLNIAFRMNISVPFFFGGDGATFIIPQSILDPVMYALSLYKDNTMANFKLDLRTGTIPVEKIYAQGQHLQLAKFSSSANFSIPIILGNGLNYAEQLIKGPDYLLSDCPAGTEELDLTGMQCRWDRIAPPVNMEEVLTVLVIAKDSTRQAAAFSKVLAKMDELYGPPQKRQPISIAQLKLKTTFSRLSDEMRARIGKIRFFELMRTWATSLYAYLYFRTQNGKNYLQSLVEMSDTLVIDGKVNTVISGLASQRASLQIFLDHLEAEGEILYGLHVSKASVMSCYVRDLEDGHIHFVDGSEGGYTQAARMLKKKLKQ